ncbi:MAG: ABC transporter permease [Acholeplasmataceae bacterium]|nr:MAG: ABC transporter permease [Acholeplasmataceae bacterium]
MISDVIKIYSERSADFVQYFLQHLTLVMTAVLFITIIGLTLGIIMTYNRQLANVVLAVTGFLYTIPSIAMFGFLVFITGIGNTSAIIAIAIYGILPLVRNTYVGIKEVSPNVIEAATGMGSTPVQLLFRIQLPLAAPVIMAGFRTTVVMTIALGGIASFIGAGGLGVPIWRGIAVNNRALTVAGSLLIALLAVTVDALLNLVEKYMRKKLYGKQERKNI